MTSKFFYPVCKFLLTKAINPVFIAFFQVILAAEYIFLFYFFPDNRNIFHNVVFCNVRVLEALQLFFTFNLLSIYTKVEKIRVFSELFTLSLL